jgi:hypothetical protein
MLAGRNDCPALLRDVEWRRLPITSACWGSHVDGVGNRGPTVCPNLSLRVNESTRPTDMLLNPAMITAIELHVAM